MLAQLVTCYNDWAKARNRSHQTDIIFLDLSKAFETFDSVPQSRLYAAIVKVVILNCFKYSSLYGSLMRGITCLKMMYTQDR